MKKSSLILGLLLSFNLHAGSVDYVNTFIDKIILTAKEKGISNAAKEEKCIALSDEYVDFEWNAKMAIGRHFKSMNELQQKEYLSLYRKLLINKWLPKIYNVSSLVNIKINKNVDQINETDEMIKGKFFFKNEKGKEDNFTIDIRVRLVDGRYKVLNILVENVDLAMSYRSDFDATITKSGIECFLSALSEKVKNK